MRKVMHLLAASGSEVPMNKLPVYLAALTFTIMVSFAAWNPSPTGKADSQTAAPPDQIADLAAAPSADLVASVAPASDELGVEKPVPEAAPEVQKSSLQANRTSTINPPASPQNSEPQQQVSRSGAQVTNSSQYPRLSEKRGIYGQFRYRELGGGRIEIDPAWVAENIVTVKLPGVNRTVQVHRLARDKFIKAFTTIANGTATVKGRKVTLLSLVKTFDGTWVTRHVNWNASKGLSNHSWGTAVDINASDHFRYVNPQTEPNDPNVILWQKAFGPAGFKWGNSYADAMHYELY